MITSKDRVHVGATGLRFEDKILIVLLSDGREVRLPLDRYEWLHWLESANVQQRDRWSLEPDGFAIYWEELDDGIEVEHLLSLDPLG